MAENAQEPIGSMGNDTALAILSQDPRLLYDYFKQIFAQVTNPPLDAIREATKTSLSCYLGATQLEIPNSALNKQIKLDSPILSRVSFYKVFGCCTTTDRIRSYFLHFHRT